MEYAAEVDLCINGEMVGGKGRDYKKLYTTLKPG